MSVALINSYIGKTDKLNKYSEELTTKDISIQLIEKDKISLGDVVRALEKEGESLSCSMLLYYSNDRKKFYHCGFTEEADRCLISIKELNGKLSLKYRKIIPIVESLSPKIESNRERRSVVYTQKNKRNKEMKIGEIVCKVSEWRKLYLGNTINNTTGKKYSLEDAANTIGIAKKTLDDYLLQIRAGRKYGFDFNIHSESKVGVLRTFVKINKNT